MEYINFPQKKVPVIYDADICVIGGSCTGVFAAIRAARLGARVVIIEKQNMFGGTATAGLVNIWHTLYDTDYKEQIIAGLTYEVEQLLSKHDAALFENNDSSGCRFNPVRLSVILDKLIIENKIKPYLHTDYILPCYSDGRINSVFVANKDGIGAINAEFFIDATGDGLVARDIGLKSYQFKNMQPPTYCSMLQGNTDSINLEKLIVEHGEEFGLDNDWGWYGKLPNLDNISFRADNHIFDVDCSKANDLTFAEIDGRRKMAAFSDLLKEYVDKKYEILAQCSSIGIRDTLHFETDFCANETDLLMGTSYEDTVMKGTYRIDIHHQEDNGITFKYLDGRTHSFYGKGEKTVIGNWRQEQGIKGEAAKYYQVPFRILKQNKFSNFIAVGRMLNADRSAFGALRVMVNLNQLGEAAGVAAAECIDKNISLCNLSGKVVRNILKKGGSAL